jgi:uncharacterized protein YbbK (DUF523 family)
MGSLVDYLRAHDVKLGVSACLLGERVRYDGQHQRHDWLVDVLGPLVTWVPVCPELELGLGVPRPPIELVRDPARFELRLIDTGSGRDLSADMRAFAAARVAGLAAQGIAGYVLKSKSPSCGVAGVKVFAGPGESAFTRSGRGLFAAALLERLPDLPVIEDHELDDPCARDQFVTRVCAYHHQHGSGARDV